MHQILPQAPTNKKHQSSFPGLGRADIFVFAHNPDDLDATYLGPIIKKFGVNVPSITTYPKDIWGIDKPQTLPATYFIKPSGEVVLSLFKPQTLESLQTTLDSLQQEYQ